MITSYRLLMIELDKGVQVSLQHLAGSILRRFAPVDVLDAACAGTGAAVIRLQRRGLPLCPLLARSAWLHCRRLLLWAYVIPYAIWVS